MTEKKVNKSDFHDQLVPGSPRQVFQHIDKRVKDKHPALLRLIKKVREREIDSDYNNNSSENIVVSREKDKKEDNQEPEDNIADSKVSHDKAGEEPETFGGLYDRLRGR